jgi:hypothetical protein
MKTETTSFPVSSQALMQPFTQPYGKVYLLYGDAVAFRLSMLAAARSLSQGASIAVVDGCNRFDVHAITRFAREHRFDPNLLLERMFVSRGFTCYQMEAAITDRLPAFIQRTNTHIGMVFGLLDTFYDEQAPLREVQQILDRVLHAFERMKALNISLLLTCTEWNVLPKERNMLFGKLKQAMDKVYRLTLDTEQRPKLFLEDHHSVILKRSA